MAQNRAIQASGPASLTTTRGAALYIGAILGPGLLLLPGLAAAQAGPASILAWLGLLALSGLFAAVFSGLGRKVPSAGGVMGYVTAGLGARAGRATGWMFLAGVVGGAPIVCLIGASYVTDLTGGGLAARAAVAAGLLLIVIGTAACGLRAGTAIQLVLVILLVVVVVVAVTGSASAERLSNWTPFAPHGYLSVGSAASTLMFSFVGWEAVAPLTTRFANPARQLPRAVAIALAVTTALYLALATATIGVLGPQAATDVPLAGLLAHVIGTAGPTVAAVAAIVLTIGTTNAYINGAIVMTTELVRPRPGNPHLNSLRPGSPRLNSPRPGNSRLNSPHPSSPRPGSPRPGSPRAANPRRANSAAAPKRLLLSAIAVTGAILLTAYGLHLVSTTALVAAPTTLFLTVYLGAMTAALRVLRGAARLAAIPGALAVLIMLTFCGWALAIPAAVTLITARNPQTRPRRSAPSPKPTPCPTTCDHKPTERELIASR
jgi:amino acid efflux transporter